MNFNSSPLESNLVSKVKKFIKEEFKQYAWFFKTSGNAAQRSGIPDIICCIKGHFIAIETKREDGSGTPSKQQMIECSKIVRAGGNSIISDDFETIKKFIYDIVNE